MSYLNYEGNRIFYEETGKGKPLILLHGNTASSKMLAPIIPLFSENHHVITIDFLGCGQSDRVRIRTLQYYDTIGTLKPIEYTESGYRLYDDTSLEKDYIQMEFVPIAEGEQEDG